MRGADAISVDPVDQVKVEEVTLAGKEIPSTSVD